ncbi:RTA1 like protein-domain-containing protein [Dipodascopsis tothii]|uniref:RTA1 like protein-domain-containing protein n=1 Tax=Dipodascopsis tothii TaxID=44089 RepID=UPI0034CE8A79
MSASIAEMATATMTAMATATAAVNGNEAASSMYTYTPSKAANLAALILFAIAWVGHTGLGAFYRQWWFGISMFIGCGLETGGYVARYKSASDPRNINDFIIQIVCLTLAPAFMMAGIYFLLAESVVIWGYQYSHLQPWTYSRIFISLDLVSIVLQAIGGAMAATALKDNDDTAPGTHIMVAGLAFQVASTSIFAVLCFLFYRNVRSGQPVEKTVTKARNALWKKELKKLRKAGETSEDVKLSLSSDEEAILRHHDDIRTRRATYWFLYTTAVAVLFIFIRSVYRVIELAEGWQGNLMIHEVYFLVLDALMMVIAALILLVLYPGTIFGRLSIGKSFRATAVATMEPLQ